jgi:hypothetical protein
MAKVFRYGKSWDDSISPLQTELWMIANPTSKGFVSRVHHFTEARRLLWPDLDEHRWWKLGFKECVENKTCVFLGCASSGKTHTASEFGLISYFADPQNTCVLVSSTTMPSLKMRIWGEITMLWEKAVQVHDFLPGHLLDSSVAITTDTLDDVEFGERKARDMRKGIFGIAAVIGGKAVGLSRYQGIKQKHVILIGDECATMPASFLSSVSNLNANEDFRCVLCGNPNEMHDPLGKSAEPIGGWSDAQLEPSKTTVWKTRFLGGVCVNFVGLDSPNFDYPQDQPTRYKYLISREKISEVLTFFAEDSLEYYAMCKGVMKIGTMEKRVLTRKMIEQFSAQKKVAWGDGSLTKVYFVDAAYGGDRCVGGFATFGNDVRGKITLSFDEPEIIPIKVGGDIGPEDQIAIHVKAACEAEEILPQNMGHDSTGRGGLGTALARVWSALTHPIEAGGRPSERPVSLDLYVTDEITKQKRLKRCDEHYDRKVSEFHGALRNAVESGQIRDLPELCVEELIARRFDRRREKHWVEPKRGTKNEPGFKERFGRSPDFADWACGIVEMARRKGFNVEKLAADKPPSKTGNTWLQRAAEKAKQLAKSRQLQAA